jgi:hypothetical protein
LFWTWNFVISDKSQPTCGQPFLEIDCEVSRHASLLCAHSSFCSQTAVVLADPAAGPAADLSKLTLLPLDHSTREFLDRQAEEKSRRRREFRQAQRAGRVPAGEAAPCGDGVHVVGRVVSVSPVIAALEPPLFFVEVAAVNRTGSASASGTSAADPAVSVWLAFSGPRALRWRAFLHPGTVYLFTHLVATKLFSRKPHEVVVFSSSPAMGGSSSKRASNRQLPPTVETLLFSEHSSSLPLPASGAASARAERKSVPSSAGPAPGPVSAAAAAVLSGVVAGAGAAPMDTSSDESRALVAVHGSGGGGGGHADAAMDYSQYSQYSQSSQASSAPGHASGSFSAPLRNSPSLRCTAHLGHRWWWCLRAQSWRQCPHAVASSTIPRSSLGRCCCALNFEPDSRLIARFAAIRCDAMQVALGVFELDHLPWMRLYCTHIHTHRWLHFSSCRVGSAPQCCLCLQPGIANRLRTAARLQGTSSIPFVPACDRATAPLGLLCGGL